MPISDTTAAYWYFWAARAVSLVGYTFMFVAPILASNVCEAAAQAVRVLVMLTSLVIAIVVILQNRDRVRQALSSRAAGGRTDFIGRSGAFLAGIWHLLAIAYLIAIFVVWLVNPTAALPFMMAATIKSIGAVIVGGLVIAFIGRFANAGLRCLTMSAHACPRWREGCRRLSHGSCRSSGQWCRLASWLPLPSLGD